MIPTSVQEIMTTEVLTVSADMFVADAAALMAEKRISCLLTVKNGKPDGILTERDLLHVASREIDSAGLTIQNLLHSPMISSNADMGVYEAFDLLIDKNIRHLCIVDDAGLLIGLVTFTNLIGATDLDDFLQTRPVSSVMTQKLQTVGREESLHGALSLMDDEGISCIVVLEEGKPAGILTERDVTKLINQGLDLQQTPVSAVMCSPVQTVSDVTPTYEVSALMQELRFRRMIVVDQEGDLTGIATQYDLIKGVQGKYIESLRQHLKDKNAELEGARKHLEEKKLLDHIVGHIPVVHYASSCDAGECIPYYVSPNIEKMFGYSPAVCLSDGTWWASTVYHEDSESVRTNFRAALQSDQSDFEHEYRINKADGSLVWVRDEMSFVRDENGEIKEIIGSWMDITDRKSSEMGFQSVVENMLDPVVIHKNGLVLFSNHAGVRLIGAESLSQILGTRVIDYLVPEDRPGAAQRITSVIAKGITLAPVEERFQSLDGRILIAEVSSTPINYDGKPCVLSICHDITESRKAALALEETERNHAMAQQIAHLGHWVLDLVENKLVWSDENYRIFGVEPGTESSYETFLDIVHPDDLDTVNEAFTSSVESQTPYNIEHRLLMQDGSIKWVYEQCKTYYDEGGTPLRSIGTTHDITERKLAEESLRKLSQVVEQAGEGILITDREGVIEYVNPAFTRLTGYTAEEAIGRTPGLLKSGHQDAALYKEMWATINSGKIWNGKVIDRTKDGRFCPLMLTISPIKNEAGEITNYAGIQQDLSEYEKLEEQFYQAQKMEAIGTLVGGIAHDFNNMLAGITGNLYLAKKRVQENPDVIHKLANVEELSFRAADMIHQLLTYARKDKISMKQLPLTPFVKEAMKFLRTSVPENIQIYQDICSEMLQINGDGTQLHQVLMNLVNNGCDALEGVDQPFMRIRLEPFQTDALFIEKHDYFEPGLYAHISVEDNGCGIAVSQMEYLFEPFFTTKDLGKGTGLGLAMVFGAVKTHHGFVEVDSVVGQGATFHVYLPILDVNYEADSPDQVEKVVEGRGETILLVDDEKHILETGTEVLVSLGYHVLTASDGEQAVELFEAHAEEIDLCVLDVVMPVMSGDEAARLMRQTRPDIKIIFASGYDRKRQTDMENETLMNKPFSIVAMSQLIRQQLDG